MSICPDKIVVSEYVDGELPSPWKEKLQSHIAECSDCEASYTVYRKISDSMKNEASGKTKNFDYGASFEKLKVKLQQRVVVHAHGNHEESGTKTFWQRSIKLPVPALAAAVLILVFLPVFMFFAVTAQNTAAQTFAYPAFQATANPVQNTGYTQANMNFNSGVTGFLRFYMPNNDKAGTYRVMSVPATIDIEQYRELFKNVPVDGIETIETIETKSPQY